MKMLNNDGTERAKLERAIRRWKLAIKSFNEAPPCEAAIASLELEAAERRYMLALALFKNNCDTTKKEERLCPISTSRYQTSESRAER